VVYRTNSWEKLVRLVQVKVALPTSLNLGWTLVSTLSLLWFVIPLVSFFFAGSDLNFVGSTDVDGRGASTSGGSRAVNGPPSAGAIYAESYLACTCSRTHSRRSNG
jgi:hypothetical protein